MIVSIYFRYGIIYFQRQSHFHLNCDQFAVYKLLQFCSGPLTIYSDKKQPAAESSCLSLVYRVHVWECVCCWFGPAHSFMVPHTHTHYCTAHNSYKHETMKISLFSWLWKSMMMIKVMLMMVMSLLVGAFSSCDVSSGVGPAPMSGANSELQQPMASLAPPSPFTTTAPMINTVSPHVSTYTHHRHRLGQCWTVRSTLLLSETY